MSFDSIRPRQEFQRSEGHLRRHRGRVRRPQAACVDDAVTDPDQSRMSVRSGHASAWSTTSWARCSHPVEGGSANDYDYCSGDPINCNDLGGTKPKSRPLSATEQATLVRLIGDCSGPDAYGADISGSASCHRFWVAFASNDLSEFGIGFTPRLAGDCPSWIKSVSRFFGVGDGFRAGNDLRQFHYRDALKDGSGGAKSNILLEDLKRQAVNAGSKIAGAMSIGGTLGRWCGVAGREQRSPRHGGHRALLRRTVVG